VDDEAIQGTHSKIGLADAVDGLRAELSEAMARARDQEIQFPVGEVHVEFQIGVTREGEGKAGLKVWVVELGAGGSYSRESVPKVTVSLEPPVTADGQRVKVHRDLDQKP
jgi:Trypsin-co-occurring domain 2